jgi:hypothetical protein
MITGGGLLKVEDIHFFPMSLAKCPIPKDLILFESVRWSYEFDDRIFGTE